VSRAVHPHRRRPPSAMRLPTAPQTFYRRLDILSRKFLYVGSGAVITCGAPLSP
jgi:hypothetical protein